MENNEVAADNTRSESSPITTTTITEDDRQIQVTFGWKNLERLILCVRVQVSKQSAQKRVLNNRKRQFW